MVRYLKVVSLAFILPVVITGCAGMDTGRPQTRDEFVTAMKSGRLFTNAENVVVNRPVRAVIADATDYANRCLNVRATAAPSYQYKSAGGSTTYRPKVGTNQRGVVALTVQEEYNNRPQKGQAPGGTFVFVAEMRAVSAGQTRVDIYYLTSRGKIADMLIKWVNGDKRLCPSFSRTV